MNLIKVEDSLILLFHTDELEMFEDQLVKVSVNDACLDTYWGHDVPDIIGEDLAETLGWEEGEWLDYRYIDLHRYEEEFVVKQCRVIKEMLDFYRKSIYNSNTVDETLPKVLI